MGVTTGDGMLVLLNGERVFAHNNPDKTASQQDVILLNLKKGTNQLLVKTFNNFQKTTPLGIDTKRQQVLYRKALPPILFQRGTYYLISWQTHQPVSPHRTLLLPNLSLELTAK